MMKAKDGKSVKTSKTLEKFAGKNTMKDLGQLKAALSEKELDFIKGLNKSKGSMTAKEKEVMNRYKDDVVPNYSKGGAMKKMGGGMMQKPMGYKSGSSLMDFVKSGTYTDRYGKKINVDKAIRKLNLSPKDKDLATMKPASKKKMMRGGAIKKAKYGKMMKASKGSMTSTEGSTNKVRGTGIAVSGTNFKGVF